MLASPPVTLQKRPNPYVDAMPTTVDSGANMLLSLFGVILQRDGDLKHADVDFASASASKLPRKTFRTIAPVAAVKKFPVAPQTADVSAVVTDRPADQQARTSHHRYNARPPSQSPASHHAEDSDPVDENFRMKLYSYRDQGKIDPELMLVRRDFLQVRRTARSKRVFLQCNYCDCIHPYKRQKSWRVNPTTTDGIYDAVVRYIREHVPVCGYIPKENTDEAARWRPDGGLPREHWVESAARKGLMDTENGIVVRPQANDTRS